MSSEDSHSKHYFILIGIDAYPDSPLKGCVGDVQDMRPYLEEALVPVQIHVLTAEEPEASRSVEAEQSATLPTYNKVLTAFNQVVSSAKAGDSVYIHYSGHGCRTKLDAQFSNPTGDLALVLLSDTKPHVPVLFEGTTLASCLRSMVEKGLTVTVVLDCCFSASVYRNDNNDVRCYLPHGAKVLRRRPDHTESTAEPLAVHPSNRDVSMQPNWLINPDRYAILAACGPQEIAKELTTEDGRKHGALSYFLLRTLPKCNGLKKRHGDVYPHLCARFRGSWPQQNPVLYGNRNQGFLGSSVLDTDVVTVPVVKRDKILRVQAGEAHGISRGDEFAVYPFGQAGQDSGSKHDPVIARVVHVEPLTSRIALLDDPAICVETGWLAEPLSCHSLGKVSVGLASDLPHRDKLSAALQERLLDVIEDVNESLSTFQIALNNLEEYKILNGQNEKSADLPPSPAPRDIGHICDMVEHLARFKLIRDLKCQSLPSSFSQTFRVQLLGLPETAFSQEGLIQVKEDPEAKFGFKLQIENRGHKTLYAHIYNMGSYAQIQNIYHGSYEVLPPPQSGRRPTRVVRKMKTTVPDDMKEKGHRECEDVIKVFVTSLPTSFDLYELPKLGQSLRTNKAREKWRDSNIAEEKWDVVSFRIRTFI